MKKQTKQAAAVSLAVCMLASLSGCASGGEKEEGKPGAPHIGIIFTQAGLGGNSFNDLTLEGVKQAAEDFGITYDQVEPKSVADEEIIQDEMASSEEYDLIICVGDEQVDALENVASSTRTRSLRFSTPHQSLKTSHPIPVKPRREASWWERWRCWPSRNRSTEKSQTAAPSDSSAAWTIR